MAIPACLVDTNILLRMTRRSDPEHGLVDAALGQMALEGTVLHYTHQNIAELWNVATSLSSTAFQEFKCTTPVWPRSCTFTESVTF